VIAAALMIALSPPADEAPGSGAGESSRQAALASIDQVRAAPRLASVCTSQGGTLRYIGPSDGALVQCLDSHRSAHTLAITSLGGAVSATLDAAQVIAERALRVEVIGVCFSSCANYLAPAAAALSVAPGSALVLHGGPDDDPDAIAEALRAALLRGRPRGAA